MEILLENGKTYLKGIMSEANYGSYNGQDFSFRGRNRNGRYYPYDILEKATNDLKESIDSDGVLAYLNHPSHGDLVYEDSCAKIVELEWVKESGRAHCKLEILEDTKDGKQVLKYIQEGKNFGISTRGAGSLDENKTVKADLRFITADIIPQFNGSMQSCQSCSLSLTENIQSDYEDYLLEVDEKTCSCIYATLDKDDQQLAEKYLISQFKSMLNK